MLRETLFFAGEDFNRSLCLAIKINLYRGKLKTQAIRSNCPIKLGYVSFFIENFWFEMAKRNQLNHELTILIDCGESDLDIKLIQYLMNLTLKHYLLRITKVLTTKLSKDLCCQYECRKNFLWDGSHIKSTVMEAVRFSVWRWLQEIPASVLTQIHSCQGIWRTLSKQLTNAHSSEHWGSTICNLLNN